MQITETKEILRLISLVDNRKVSPEVIEAWHGVIGAIPFDIAKEALKLAQQDASIKYLEPRHIVGWSKEAAFRLDRHKPKQQETTQSEPMPRCKEHSKPILLCDPCCNKLYRYADSQGLSQSHAFAKAEIYG